MKKSIGLTADISTFNTTLPQTRHLNYFMGTNPRRYASGGEVSQGIPNYPNPNVTNGFLPMALGFDNNYPVPMAEAGDAGFMSRLYTAAVEVVAGYLKKSPNDPDVQETAKKFIGTEEGKKIAEQYLQSQGGSSSGAPQDTGTPVPVKPMPNTPPPGLMPTDTVTVNSPISDTLKSIRETVPSIPPGGYPGAPSAESQTTLGIGPNLNTIPGKSSGAPQDTGGGIASIKPKKELPFYLKPLDLNGDGEVNIEDYKFAKETGSKYGDAIKKYLGIVDDKLEEWAEKDDAIAKPDLPDEDNKIIVPKTKTPPGGYPGAPSSESQQTLGIGPRLDTSLGQSSGAPQDTGGITEINKKDSKEVNKALKIADDLAGGGDGGGITDKKDVPSWALPMMSAGFAMMASKSPYFMQALGEAGQAGVESYSAQETAKEDKLDKQATRDLQKSQAKYYEGREQKPDIKILTVDGKGVYHKWDSSIANADGSKGNYVSLNKVAVPSDAEIETELAKIYGERWALIEFKEKQKLINEKKNQYLGIASDNVASGNEAASKGGNWLPDWFPSIPSLSEIDKRLVEIDKRLNQ